MKKLQNSFNEFLPQKFKAFRRSVNELTSNQSVVHELLRICCEEDDVKAIQMAFERILGKPEKVIVIKKTIVRTVFPDAQTKSLKAVVDERVQDEFVPQTITETAVVVDEKNAPGILLRKMIEEIGDKPRQHSYNVLDDKDSYSVAEVMTANLYGIAMRGSNLGAIRLLFDYLDGAVADVIRLDGESVIEVESWADVAPFEAIQGDDGVYYVETESVK